MVTFVLTVHPDEGLVGREGAKARILDRRARDEHVSG